MFYIFFNDKTILTFFFTFYFNMHWVKTIWTSVYVFISLFFLCKTTLIWGNICHLSFKNSSSRTLCVLKNFTAINQHSCIDLRKSAMLCVSYGLLWWWVPAQQFTEVYYSFNMKTNLSIYFSMMRISTAFLRDCFCKMLDPTFSFISKSFSSSSEGNRGSWSLAGWGLGSWKEIALHLVQPANVLVHSCTAIDLTSFWMFTGLAIISWIFYSSITIITVITFALLQNLLSKDFKVLYGC